MSQTRAAIARLSFVLRIFLYVALLGAVAYIGFAYSAGYVAVPGDTLLRFNSGDAKVVILRNFNCEIQETPAPKDANPQAAAPGAPPLPPAPPQPGMMGNCAQGPMLGLRSIPLGPMKQIAVLRDDHGNEVEVRRETGSGKAHLTIRNGGKTTEHDVEGKTVPAGILAEIPAEMRAGVQNAVANPPAPPQLQSGNNSEVRGSISDDDGTRIEFERKDGGKGHLTITRAGKTSAYDVDGKTIPADALAQIPEKDRAAVQQMVSGEGLPVPPPPPGPPGAPGFFTMPVPPPSGGMLYRQLGPSGPPAGDFLYRRFGPGGPPPDDLPFAGQRVMELPGPAIVQQQVLGHTGIRAGLVGITIALVFLAIIQLERLLAHFQKAELFSSRNSGLLRNLGALLIAVALVQGAATLLPAFLARTLHPALIGALGPHLLLVFGGSALLLLAAVWAEAARLEDETAHTV